MMVAVMLIIMRLMILKVFEDEDEEHNTCFFFLTDAFLQGLGTYCHVIQQESTHLYNF